MKDKADVTTSKTWYQLVHFSINNTSSIICDMRLVLSWYHHVIVLMAFSQSGIVMILILAILRKTSNGVRMPYKSAGIVEIK